MHIKPVDRSVHPAVVSVRILCDDPEGLGMSSGEVEIKASRTQTLLEAAMEHGINIEHACGGVCACSTCHVYVEKGMEHLSESTDAEEDRVEEAPGLQRNSRLSCQCEVRGDGPIQVRVPAWNRNAVKEVPH